MLCSVMSEVVDEVAARPRVLVVDDEDAIRRMMRLTLSRCFEVFEAHDARGAIEQVAAHDFEVVVTDVMMPGMSGIEACPLIRAKARGPIHILLLTALDDQEHRNQGLEAGADDYLGKPVDRKELLLRVQHFVRLGRQERVIRQQLEALSQLQALKDDLTALLVHDLRNPLTAVKSALQLLEPVVPPADRDLILLGKNALNRVLEGVGDLLKVRMLEQGELQLERSTLDPAALAREVAETLRAAALDGNVEVTVIAPGGLTVQADAKLLKRALENLLINAFRHTKKTVDIELSRRGEQLVIAVSDRGSGVPDFLKGELFDMFGSVKLKNSGGRRGHGLGLYLVRLVAQAHGGDVKVTDREGGGASFVMSLAAG
jgi:signal transduction histidine kinase